MPTIAGELQTSTEDATECDDLVDFSCGDGRLEAEAAVERIVAGCRSGRLSGITMRVTREVPPGALVGISAIEWPGLVLRHPDFPSDAYKDAAYVAVLALNAQYRGGYQVQNGEPLSHALMADALRFIASAVDGEVPPVQAIIDPRNAPSRALCEHFGFIQPIVTEPDLWYVRPRGLPLEEPSEEGKRAEDEEADK